MKNLVAIDFDKVLYHGLCNHDSADDWYRAIVRLDKALEAGGILSRRKQIEKFGMSFDKRSFIAIEGKSSIEAEKANWNGDDRISICKKVDDDEYRWGGNPYKMYIKRDYLSLILDAKVLKELPVEREYSGKYCGCQYGEYQIKDIVPRKYFIGVGVGLNFGLGERLASGITEVMRKNNFDVPLYAMDLRLFGKELSRDRLHEDYTKMLDEYFGRAVVGA